MANYRLFDAFERTDPSPCRNAEDQFTFLNRALGDVWSRVREKLEEYFSGYPDGDAAVDLRSRFRSTIRAQHLAAWWELYLFALFSRLGYSLSVHPEVPNSARRPDFWVEGAENCFYLEAAAVFPEVEDDRPSNPLLEAQLLDIVNEVQSSSFFVGLEISESGQVLPRRTEIVSVLQRWLDHLDADEVISSVAEGDPYPSTVIRPRDWVVEVTAFPVSPKNRGAVDRVIGTYPATGGIVTDHHVIRKTVRKKAHRYGDLQAPYVVAVMSDSSFSGGDAFEHALFGSIAYSYFEGRATEGKWVRTKDGVFMAPDRARATSVSAVLSAVTLAPWSQATVVPTLWLNPWADHPISIDDGFPIGTSSDRGEVSFAAGTISVNAVLNLDRDWPGMPW